VLGPKALFEALSGQTWTAAGKLVNRTDPKSGRNLTPLVQVDKFNVRTDKPGTGSDLGNGVCFRDPDGNPYLYFPAQVPTPDITKPNAYVGNWNGSGTVPMYNWRDCSTILTQAGSNLSQPDMQYLLGDGRKSPPYPTAAAPDGAITAGETASTTGPYILWAAGPDGLYGISNNKTDDVANFDFPAAYRK
jgi:hypothetical protein